MFETIAFVFAACLPASVYSSAVCLMAAGLFRESWEQPLAFRVISRGDFPSRNRVGMFWMWGGFFVTFNALPALLVTHSIDSRAAATGWVYFAVLGLWFAYVSYAALRARSIRRSLSAEDLAELSAGSDAPRTRIQTLIDRLDLEDAVESGTWSGGQPLPLPPQPNQIGGGIEPTEATGGSGEPCAVYPVDWQRMSPKFDVQTVTDSFQGAMVLTLAKLVDPRFPSLGSGDPDLVVRSRVLRADPGNRLLRFLFPFVAGSAVFEIEAEIAHKSAPIAHVHALGKRRWALSDGGDSQDMLVDAAKLAGKRAAVQLIAALGARATSNSIGR
jgi:hypothetical protein